MALSIIISKLSKLPRIKPLFMITSQVPHFISISSHFKCAPFLNPRKTNFVFRRTFFQFFKKPSMNQLKEIDGVPPEYILIYRNGMEKYLQLAQVISTASAAIVCISVLLFSRRELEGNSELWGTNEPLEYEGVIYATGFVIICVFLNLVVTRMPARIYNYPPRQKYVFVFYGALPTTRKYLGCKLNEVIKLEETGLLPWKDSRYEIINKKRIIMLDHYFRKPSDLNIMLGYEKQSDDYD